MKRLKAALPVLAAIVATWWFTVATTAQTTIPNGVFVQDGTGILWLILDGKKVAVPIWFAPPEDVRLLPQSDRWAVMNEAGAIVAGDMPSWAVKGDPSPLYYPTSPLETRTVVPDATGQVAVGTFQDQAVRATVTEMSILDALPPVDAYEGRFFTRHAQGKFVVVAVRLENVGRQAVCCVPRYRLRDIQGRIFTQAPDDASKQAMLTVYLITAFRGDLQPNMPVPYVLVYDVPIDARGFLLFQDR